MRNPIVLTLIAIALILSAVGCAPFQSASSPAPATSLPTVEPAAPTAVPTATLPSTVQVLDATRPPELVPTDVPPTLTPAIQPPSPTPWSERIYEPLCDELGGRIVEASFSSDIARGQFDYRIYLPPCYDMSARRYPYLIIMHGLVPGTEAMNDSQWDDMGLDESADLGYRAGTLPPMIIVMPDGNDVMHGNDDSPYVSLIVNDLLPHLEESYCTWNEPAYRAIGGLSRGGFWALSTAFLNPELFDRVGGHSPFLYDGDYPVYNPFNLADTVTGIERLQLYVDHGAQDYVQDGVRAFMDKMQRRGVPSLYVVNPTGTHTEEYWSAHTADYLHFYAEAWSLDASTYPPCAGAS